MKMFVFLLDLKEDPNLINIYLERHKNVEPEVPKKLKEMGVLHNRINRLGTRLVNILITNDSFRSKDLSQYVENAACKTWDDEMMKYQQKAPGAKENEWWASADTVYIYDSIGIG